MVRMHKFKYCIIIKIHLEWTQLVLCILNPYQKKGQKKCSNGVIMLDTTIKSRCQWNPVSGHQQATKIWPY